MYVLFDQKNSIELLQLFILQMGKQRPSTVPINYSFPCSFILLAWWGGQGEPACAFPSFGDGLCCQRNTVFSVLGTGRPSGLGSQERSTRGIDRAISL